jgi:hypothetical protein
MRARDPARVRSARAAVRNGLLAISVTGAPGLSRSTSSSRSAMNSASQ